MIGKVKVGKSFGGICRYVFGEDKQAQVLDAEGVRTDSAAHMAQDFQFQQAQRPGLGNAVLHVALALPAEDAHGRSPEQLAELLREVGRAYVQAMKLENTQWALVQHFDTPHPHAHLVVNRVDNEGQTIKDHFIGQQSRRVCQGLEQQLGLSVAEQQGRDQAREVGLTHRQATATTPKQERDADWQRTRHAVANALKHTAPYSAGFDELQAKLTRHGVAVQLSTHQKKDGPAVYGVTFEKEGHRFKGSEVAKEYSASKLQQAFAQHQVQAPALGQQADQAAKTYAAEALNRLLQAQARQAQEKAQETARQATPAPQRQPPPGRNQSGELEM
jgi:D-arabinose 1-dehydrogenase-like Zn-dependent alcohol dehydrogenase